MKTRNTVLTCIISFCIAIIACDDTNTEMVEFEQKGNISNNVNSSGEEKAIEAFNTFVENLNDKASTRGLKSQIVQVKKYPSALYNGNKDAATRSAENETPVYELVLENQDNTKGFAVVAEFPTSSDVVAYAPVGSVTDTVFNEGLAMFFREFAYVTEVRKKQAAAIRATAEYWQPNPVFQSIPGTVEYYRDMTEEESKKYDIYYYKVDPVDFFTARGPLVTTQWEQNAPYNNKVPVFVTGTNNRVKVGCFAVALAQLMSYHQKPASYNWGIMKSAPTVSVYDYAASDEVSRLMIDIATAGGTRFDRISNVGSTTVADVKPAIEQMGYKLVATYLGLNNSGDSIYNNIMNNRPVLMDGQTSNSKGHIWLIDGIFTQERWQYFSQCLSGTHIATRYMIMRYRERSRLCHCNWGWGGLSNGWYYSYSPVYTDGLNYWLGYDKNIYTQMTPR